MDKQSIRSVWAKFLEVQEAAYGKKKEGLDPVGKADDDIDNDGDVDSSDKYLKNRRKAIGKSMKKDDEKEVKEGELPPALKKNAEKKKKEAGKDDTDDKEEMDESSCGKDRMKKEGKKDPKDPHGHKKAAKKPLDLNPNKTTKVKTYEEKEECPKCKGEGCDHCDDKGYHEVEKEAYGKKMKESNLFSDDELAALEEKMKHVGNPPGNVPSAPAEPEKFMQTSSAGEKKTFDDHQKGNEKKYEDWEDTSEHDGVNAGRAVKSQSPARKGDNLKVGDNAMPTVKKVKGQ